MSDITKNKYLNGLSSDAVQFENRSAMVEAMQDPRYKNDPEYRNLVSHMLRKPFSDDVAKAPTVVSSRDLARAMSDPAGARKSVLRELANEHAQNLFMAKDENGKLKYETSAIYRESVRQYLIDHNDEIDAAMGDSFQDRNANKGAVRVTFGEGSAEASRQAIADKRAADEKAELKEKHDRVDAGLSSDVFSLDGRKA
jgi:hypothetical protein